MKNLLLIVIIAVVQFTTVSPTAKGQNVSKDNDTIFCKFSRPVFDSSYNKINSYREKELIDIFRQNSDKVFVEIKVGGVPPTYQVTCMELLGIVQINQLINEDILIATTAKQKYPYMFTEETWERIKKAIKSELSSPLPEKRGERTFSGQPLPDEKKKRTFSERPFLKKSSQNSKRGKWGTKCPEFE